METNLRRRRGVVIVELKGRMQLGEQHETLLPMIEEQMDAGEKAFLLDLGKVTAIDSSGIGELVASHLQVTREGGNLHLLRPSPKVVKVLEMAKLKNLFPVHDAEEAGLRALEG